MFKKWVIDEFLQKWSIDMNMCNYIPMLKHCKINFGYEMYLDILPSKLRNILTKLRSMINLPWMIIMMYGKIGSHGHTIFKTRIYVI